MKKLPLEEALRRKIERERIRCELRKQARIQRQIEKGIYNLTPEQKRLRKIATVQRHRAKLKALLPPKPPKQVKPKTPKPEKLIKVQPVPKPKVMPRPKATKTQPRVFKTLAADPTKIKVRLDHRTEVYIRPDQDIEAVKARYLNR